MTFNALYTTVWQGQAYYLLLPFENSAQSAAYFTNTDRINARCAWINKNKSTFTEAQFHTHIRAWLRFVMEVHNDHGGQTIPVDIRAAVHDAQDILGMLQTDFGPDLGTLHPINQHTSRDTANPNIP